MSRIIELRAENLKRIRAVTIRPDGNVIVIGGQNAQGKTSCIDAIAYCIGGAKLVPSEPIRRGEHQATVEVDLGDIIVKRTFKAGGNSYLAVEGKDGKKFPSPQAMLDKLVGSLSFDPLEFSRMEPKKQAAALRDVVGLDFSDLDERRAALFEERTLINRQLKNAEGALSAAPHHVGAPKQEINIAAVSKELQDAMADNATYAQRVRDHDNAVSVRVAAVEKVNDLREALASAERALDIAVKREEEMIVIAEEANLVTADLAPLQQKIASADAINRQVRDNANYAKLRAERDKLQKESGRLSKAIDDVDADKKEQLAAAKFPVPGLSFTESGVVLNDLPFEQASAAEQLKVSVAMGLSLNPQLRVLLVRDGSLLDDASLAMLAEMAAAADAQVWLERVGEGDEVTVIIEDGSVKLDRTLAAASA